MTDAKSSRIIGYLCALGAGAVWGTTGPLSTKLYAEGAAITGIGFWRLILGTAGLALWALLFHREVFKVDRKGMWLMGGLGGAMVALFEVAYQFGIAGAGVAGAAALLYTAPVMVALVAKPLLGEKLTPLRFALATVVMIGAAMTVMGKSGAETSSAIALPSLVVGVIGGLLAAVSFATTTVLARWTVPLYGSYRMLFWEALGGVIIIAIVLGAVGLAKSGDAAQLMPLPPTSAAWAYTFALAIGGVILANFLFFAGVRRIEATPTAVAATIEPVVGALLAFLLLSQALTFVGWVGLLMVVGGVAAGYILEGLKQQLDAQSEQPGRPV
ncbi:MAG TPA: EamA family transporter [Gemmatimonadales bacterium]|nr:EamA family transporter [Gemmatimonadales bacterium]